ncbi:hypothetical protein JK167_13295 [Levilactobacillus brevis]|uniref:Uncharacterized protein n=1 Tax=Levilactobacillus brevis TaxID=1580 RepID=A0AA41JUR5_LEVBR|nr:hypothetical protein [Levilactobacillus brevis]MBS0948617.1 hypothetical protein [Levilactobacillus brevis]MBS1011781.1 hypothetical protein [Levilactobacillus brevis]
MGRRWLYILSFMVMILSGATIAYCLVEQHGLNQQLDKTTQQISQVKANHTKTSKQTVHYVNAAEKKPYDVMTDFFKDMYGYKNGKDYLVKRQSAVKLIDTERISDGALKKLYSTGIDSAGQNMITTLGQKSQVTAVNIYRTNGLDAGYQVLVTYQVTNNSTPTPKTGSAWYEVKVDQFSNKISELKKVGTTYKL